MLLNQLKDIVGPKGWTSDESELAPQLSERRSAVVGRTAIMLSPKSTEEVAAVVRLCSQAGVAIVPQGGNTGLCGGQIPDKSGEQILLSLSRLNRIRRIDAGMLSGTAHGRASRRYSRGSRWPRAATRAAKLPLAQSQRMTAMTL